MRTRRYSSRVEEVYCARIWRFILFHGRHHPRDLGPAHVEAFLTQLATDQHVSALTQNQALAAIIFTLHPRCRGHRLLGGPSRRPGPQVSGCRPGMVLAKCLPREVPLSRQADSSAPAASLRVVREAALAAGLSRRASCHPASLLVTHLREHDDNLHPRPEPRRPRRPQPPRRPLRPNVVNGPVCVRQSLDEAAAPCHPGTTRRDALQLRVRRAPRDAHDPPGRRRLPPVLDGSTLWRWTAFGPCGADLIRETILGGRSPKVTI
ncbi:site-specific integrase [Sorangium sp. So ce375]|uniref:site-specific integrase n=1 Tax=Sorangium sp. So ce375 TaxID=3133306 RepID=UPI003F5B9AB1